jgi:hypothetical protein
MYPTVIPAYKHHAVKSYSQRGGKAPFILNLSSKTVMNGQLQAPAAPGPTSASGEEKSILNTCSYIRNLANSHFTAELPIL